MKPVTDLELALKMWELVDDATEVYVTYIVSQTEAAICVETYRNKKIKILRVFLEPTAATKYITNKTGDSIGSKIGLVRFGFLCEKLSLVYAEDVGEVQLTCVLTSVDSSGKLYDIDVLWALTTN